ncbi:ABC transporter permease [Amphibacillus indicireducens]|uniref:ABC transporter permease n=1 Tax=Amphibacillus indicireducens TaxID=1076330 RepID=A0ABP7VGE3_9BACI
MKKTAVHKLVIREILNSKARFFSIFVLILLGVGFFAGLQATGPNMLVTVDDYFDSQKLYDAHVQSTLGIENAEIELLSEYGHAEFVEAGFSQDVLVGKSRHVMKLISYHPDKQLNQYLIESGRLPERSGEIALDERDMIQNQYEIGDQVTLYPDRDETDLSEQFERIDFEIVGFIRSPRYFTHESRGQTPIAGGQLDAFGVILEEDFNLPVYTDLFITFSSLRVEDTFSDEYKNQSRTYGSDIEQTLAGYAPERLVEIQVEAEKEIDEAEVDIAEGRAELEEARAELADARAKLDDGQEAIEEARAELEQGYQELTAGEAAYEQGLAKFKTEMKQAREQLEAGRVELELEADQLNQGLAELELGEAELNQVSGEIERQREQLLNQQENIQGLSDVIAVPIDFIPEAEIERILAETESVELNGQTLADLFAGYFAGVIPAEQVERVVKQINAELEAGLTQIDEATTEIVRQRSELNAGRAELEAGQELLNEARIKLDQQTGLLERERSKAEAELTTARIELDQGWQEYNEGIVLLDEQDIELSKAEQEYEEGLATFEEESADALEEIEEGEVEIAKAREELTDLTEPTYYTFLRKDHADFVQYEDNAGLLSELATIFPAVFFAVAALVTLTTITRMIEEQRGEIGTLKAFGYRDLEISLKYYVYALGASLLGTLFGLVLGYTFLPVIIFNAYGMMYNLPDLILANYWSYTVIATAIAMISTVVTAWFVLRSDLKSQPAVLMRPKAPKIGKRIFLERMTLVWRRLDFIKKVTARNLFRYKQRMLMTIVGIAGCAALIIAGFGIRGAVEGLLDLQFGNVMNYDAMVILDDEATEEAQASYQQFIESYDGIDQDIAVFQQQFEVSYEGHPTQGLTVMVPEDIGSFNDFIQLKDRKSDQAYQLTNDGGIITERLANLFELEPGDDLTIIDSDNQSYQIKITAITENYTGHYLYLTKAVYQTEIANSLNYNSSLLKHDQDDTWEDQLSEQLMLEEQVISVSFIASMTEAFRDSMASLNIVVVVLILSAAGLAFVVLYNLTNINVSERIRELSTIKVLGFYDNEVTMYIYRENLVLTMMGILAGSIFGRFLFSFVMETIAMDNMMFNPALHWTSYLYAGLLTLLFSTLVMWMMHHKLKRIDMIEALKSNE